MIGNMKAWRALPATAGPALEIASNIMKVFMGLPALLPPIAVGILAVVQGASTAAAAATAAEGNSAAPGKVSGAFGKLTGENAQLTAKFAADSVPPPKIPAAILSYTKDIKAKAAAAVGDAFKAIGGSTDMHNCPIPCPIPPHGPGMVTKGSKTVLINNLPAARQGDKVFEACGGGDPIAKGCPTVDIGDMGAGGGGGGSGDGSGKSVAGVASGIEALLAAGESAGGDIAAASMEVASLIAKLAPPPEGPAQKIQPAPAPCECTNPDCACAFSEASKNGTPLIDRDTYGCAGPPVESVDTGDHWVEIALVGDDDQGVANEPFVLKLPNGEEIRGNLGADGSFRIEGITGSEPCKVQFPKLDEASWEPL